MRCGACQGSVQARGIGTAARRGCCALSGGPSGLLRLADRYLCMPFWSADIHAEWIRSLLPDLPDPGDWHVLAAVRGHRAHEHDCGDRAQAHGRPHCRLPDAFSAQAPLRASALNQGSRRWQPARGLRRSSTLLAETFHQFGRRGPTFRNLKVERSLFDAVGSGSVEGDNQRCALRLR